MTDEILMEARDQNTHDEEKPVTALELMLVLNIKQNMNTADRDFTP